MKKTLTMGSLFAGIGGFDLGFERAGFKTIWQVEIDEYCRRVLARHFPDAERFGDIRECGAHNLKPVDVITGGFPCQPFSTSGKRPATNDDRYLWPEMLRVIQALRPNIVLAENVAGIAHEFDWVLDNVLSDLEAAGYETIPPLMVPACAFGAWHRRDRVWILAHLNEGVFSPQQEQQQAERAKEFHRRSALYADANGHGFDRAKVHEGFGQEGRGEIDIGRGAGWGSEPAVGRMVYGVSTDMDRRRVEALGNAVVPQIAEWIARRILEVEQSTQ